MVITAPPGLCCLTKYLLRRVLVCKYDRFVTPQIWRDDSTVNVLLHYLDVMYLSYALP